MHYGPTSSEIDSTRYPELRKWVVGCLSGHKKPNEIIFQLCRRTGWDWGQAKKFVEQVVEMDQKQVHQKRMPLLLFFGVLLIVSGAISFISAFYDMTAVLSTLEPPLDAQKIVNAALMSRSIYLMLLKLFYGLLGVIGGSYGTLSAVKAAMTGEGDDLLKSETQP
ncbi:MAG: hypothetical protein JW748_12860 [Anaerolineales bacterium]|nr:hypothetical protein [Anaerolineales bacterium]